MQLILTHEQADFDAMASLLGASIIQKDAIPVMPRILNRNVQSFMELYGDGLPFVKFQDLPKENIETVTLVDSQSLITIKGLTKKTKIYIIDHHKKKEDLPKKWTFTYVETSACTTYFIEELMERSNYQLSIIESTLLLLGIHEDTGSLTYANTTARDVSAVAYVLNHGASLKIAVDFLNPPLSTAQQNVFNVLVNNATNLSIEDVKIFISHADAPSLEDEVSSIAHKITDLMDPDALFIFVKTKEGIRLVARSSTDQVNAAQIAHTYGGGGHDRASAALIQENKKIPDQAEKIVKAFIGALPTFIKPAITAEDIMSKKPMTISPQTSAQEAFHLMQKFGYEGYPVVENEIIKGLLTRRAVDKAYIHKIPLSASSLMQAGEVFVHSTDSMQRVQMKMSESGWGQIPVVDPITKEIIGIITRTDLLKTLAGVKNGDFKHINFAEKIMNYLSPQKYALVKIISQTAGELNTPLYIVGGFVRDLVLDYPSPDLDFVVEGNALSIAKHLSNLYGGKITTHKKFGTAKWWPDYSTVFFDNDIQIEIENQKDVLPSTIDLISSRTEFYEKPTVLPTIKTGSIKLDLHRRDFTINTMAIRLDGDNFGSLYDYWGGMNDIKRQNIRVLHSLSFIDDPTRMLRAIRFEQRFGFNIESRTLELLREAVPHLNQVSGDRIRHELDQIIQENNCPQMFDRIESLKLWNSIHPAIHWDITKGKNISQFLQTEIQGFWKPTLTLSSEKKKIYGTYILLLRENTTGEIERIIKRLRFKRFLQDVIQDGSEFWHTREKWARLNPGDFTIFAESKHPFALYCHWLFEKDGAIREKIKMFITKWQHIKPITDGQDLMRMGLAPSPIFKEILNTLRKCWIEGTVENKKQEKELLNKIITEIS